MLCFYIYINMYMCIYIHIKKKVLYPNTWIFQVHGKKTVLKLSQQNGPFFSFPDFKESEQGLWCQM